MLYFSDRQTISVILHRSILLCFIFQPLSQILQILTSIKAHLIVPVYIFGAAVDGQTTLESPNFSTPFVKRLVVFLQKVGIAGELLAVAPAFVVEIEIRFFYRISHAKYYTHTTQTQYDVHSLHSGNLYQIFTYVKNKDTEFGDAPHTVSGMLLYAATDEAIQPNNSYLMSGNKISVKTLDLNQDFAEIALQLNRIVDEHFVK